MSNESKSISYPVDDYGRNIWQSSEQPQHCQEVQSSNPSQHTCEANQSHDLHHLAATAFEHISLELPQVGT